MNCTSLCLLSLNMRYPSPTMDPSVIREDEGMTLEHSFPSLDMGYRQHSDSLVITSRARPARVLEIPPEMSRSNVGDENEGEIHRHAEQSLIGDGVGLSTEQTFQIHDGDTSERFQLSLGGLYDDQQFSIGVS